MDLSLENFSPTKAELTKIAEESKSLTITDPFDTAQYKQVKDAKNNLVHVRNEITKTGKSIRDKAIAYQKAVIKLEGELVDIITPEEERLAELLEKADIARVRQARVELLPHRKERLAMIGDDVIITDDYLLDLDGAAFESYFNERVAMKNEADRLMYEAERKTLDAEREKLQREQELAEAEERGRKLAVERLEREQRARDEHQAHANQLAEAEAKWEKEELEKESRYQHFLTDNGYTESNKETFHVERKGDDVRLYRLVGILTLK